MFAARFDPNALIVEETPSDVEEQFSSNETNNKKRKLESDGESSSSEDDSESDSDSDSDGESESESDSENAAKSNQETEIPSGEAEIESSSESESEDDSESESEAQSEENEDVPMEEDTEEAEQFLDSDIEMADSAEVVNPSENEEPIIQEHESKYSSIISRFNKSLIKSSKLPQDQDSDSESEPENFQDLKPLPQPALPRDQRLSRTYTNNNLSWLTTTPYYIKPDELKPFSQFPLLSTKIQENLAKVMNFDNAFATQIQTLDILLPEISNTLNPVRFKGDLLVNASTGSGKTLAYSIPIIQSLQNRVVPKLACVIIVPTKPLINQVYKTLTMLSRGISLNIVTLGTKEISLREESKKLKSHVPDIIVSTPGRFVDHLNLESISLKHLQWCVIDEADRLLNQSFQDWSNTLITKLNEVFDKSQNNNISQNFKLNFIKMIFSATLTTDPGKLTNLKFNKPRLIIVNDEEQLLKSEKQHIFTLPTQLSEHILKFSSASSSVKPLLLLNLIKNKLIDGSSGNVLIFTNSNEATIRLSRLLSIIISKLKLQITVSNINSTLSKAQISKTLQSFIEGSINVVISTDLMARGMDIATIKHVVNYDLPNSSREYVHRVGRTARANQSGYAYNFLIGKGEEKFFKTFEMDIGRNENVINDLELDSDVTKSWTAAYEESLKQLEQEVHKSH
ncbi:hypothetical protein WICPIJ_001197 [Wickerhamomyces pijperi]|uniref:ATP-dependent RNA helicase n=1 Tax=Wickerhamomyces pijperi TaxID=599730 RepID=A0A9P8QE53_WICPI|nr:hypothetical protein WICPIJ_001197 [Wickerhamomyces pijperi]